jgi:RND family efflux transporter MFP subunit
VKEGDALVRILQAPDQPFSQAFPIRAPFSGTVTQILKSPGEYVTATGGGTSVLRLDDLSEFWIDAAVPEIDVAKLKVGLPAIAKPNALNGDLYAGILKSIALSSKEAQDRWDRGKVEFQTTLQISKPDAKLKPGMSVVVDVIAAQVKNVLTLPHEFIHREGVESFVITKSGERKSIEVGLSNETKVEIKSGLTEGLEVQMVDFSQISLGAGGAGKRGRSSR